MNRAELISWLRAHKAIKSINCDSAWWYENKGSIEIFCFAETPQVTMSCRISRVEIEAWLKRAKRKAK